MSELRALVRRAEILALAGAWDDESIRVNTRILELDDHVAGAYTRLARCFRAQGNWLAARSMYQQVLAFNPSSRIASNQLVAIEEILRDLEDIELISKIDDYDEAFATGVAARRQGNVTLAVAALERAVGLRPTVYALTALGAAYRSDGRLAEAEVAYQRAINVNGHVAARVGLAAVYADRGRLTDASRIYRQILDVDDRNVYALNGLGALLLKRGRLEQAEGCFVRSAEIGEVRDESMSRLADLGAEYARCGDAAGARRIQAVLDRLRPGGRPGRS
jgi:tetratricopeptide (TPR) repeat protein